MPSGMMRQKNKDGVSGNLDGLMDAVAGRLGCFRSRKAVQRGLAAGPVPSAGGTVLTLGVSVWGMTTVSHDTQ